MVYKGFSSLKMALVSCGVLVVFNIHAMHKESAIPVTYYADDRCDKSTQLLNAASRGDTMEVKRLLEAKVKTSVVDTFWERTPLAHAAKNGHIAVVRTLVEAKVAVADDEEALVCAAQHDTGEQQYTDIIFELLSHGADVNALHGRMVRMVIARNNKKVFAHLLQRKDVNWNLEGAHGETALKAAVYYDRLDMLKKLLTRVRCSSRMLSGLLKMSVAENNESVKKCLLAVGASYKFITYEEGVVNNSKCDTLKTYALMSNTEVRNILLDTSPELNDMYQDKENVDDRVGALNAIFNGDCYRC